jgi:hypothetical protein
MSDAHPISPAPQPPLRRSLLQNVLPFLSSLAAHALILIIGVMAARVIISIAPAANQEQINPADGLLATNLPGADTNPVPTLAALDRMIQENDSDTSDRTGIAEHKGLSTQLTAAGGGTGEEGPADLIVSGAAGKGRGSGFGVGDRFGTGDGADGPLRQFGHLKGPGGGTGIFVRTEDGVRKVAFVCDGSGSMITKMALLRDELAKAVDRLTPVQAFNVIFFQEPRFVAWNEADLQMASLDHKRQAIGFLEQITPAGTTDPIPGLELAFRQRPQLIYLLTDGDFADNQAVRRRINELNKDRRVRINTIAFVSESDRDQDFLDLLKQIARENGGSFRYVRDTDLNR